MEEEKNHSTGAMRAQPQTGRGKFFLGLLIAVPISFLVACGLPILFVLFQSEYRFDARGYFEVFIHTYHDVSNWFKLGWPEILMTIGVVIGPIVGGMILHSFRPRVERPGTSKLRDILWTALTFAVPYSIAGVGVAALAASSHPYAFEWPEFFRFQGTQQMVTLFILAAAMSAVGAVIVEALGQRRRRTLPT